MQSPRLRVLFALSLWALAAAAQVPQATAPSGDAAAETARPVLSINSVDQGSAVAGERPIDVVFRPASDGVALAEADVLIDGVAKLTFDLRPEDRSVTYNWDTRDVADGKHVIQAVVTDKEGRSRTYETFVYVRNNPGAISGLNSSSTLELLDKAGAPAGTLTGDALIRVVPDPNIGAQWVIIYVNDRFKAMLNRPPYQDTLLANPALAAGPVVVRASIIRPDESREELGPITAQYDPNYTRAAGSPAPNAAIAGPSSVSGAPTAPAAAPTMVLGADGVARPVAEALGAGTPAVRPGAPSVETPGVAQPVAALSGLVARPATRPAPLGAGAVSPAPSALPPSRLPSASLPVAAEVAVASTAAPVPARPVAAPSIDVTRTSLRAPGAPVDGQPVLAPAATVAAPVTVPGWARITAEPRTAVASPVAEPLAAQPVQVSVAAPAGPAPLTVSAPSAALAATMAPPRGTQAPLARPRSALPSGKRALPAVSRAALGPVVAKMHAAGRGDTVKTVAQRFGVTETQLRRLNKLGAGNKLREGQMLLVPHGDLLVNGVSQTVDVAPLRAKAGIDTAPLRFVVQGLGGTVTWIGPSKTVQAEAGDQGMLTIKIGSREAEVGGEQMLMDLAAYLDHDRTMVPARFISEAFDVTIELDPNSGSISIRSNK